MHNNNTKFNTVVFIILLFSSCFTQSLFAQNTNQNKFKQLGQELPTPNTYRTASGAPGHEYWQQQVDYVMDIKLNDDKQTIQGEAKITYINNSPDGLDYLWLQLDQNVRAKDSDSYKIRQSKPSDKMSPRSLKNLKPWFDGGFKITDVSDTNGKDLDYIINKTMLRVDLDKTLQAGESIEFNIDWWYNINDRSKIGGRGGYEYFEENDNYLYTIAQFYPRLCMYNDVYGWQNKQFLGAGEFTLNFGDYDVSITVPSDHLVASTGVLQNEDDVLTQTQRDRLKKAKNSYDDIVIIATQKEAEKREKGKVKSNKTWKFKAKNVRDFAFATSRKFIWDAMAVKQDDGTTVMAMSMYPKEGNPLWEKYSTEAVAHTLKWYSHYTFPYPYPVAWSINAAQIGMEYPMICFNYGRCEDDGTYSKRIKYGMISVIIHEVGHNYFPMIVNSDERQWTWMDEGLNTFLQYLTEQQWSRNYPSRRGPAHKIVNYMKGDKSNITPIMTNSESIFQFGNNAYGKPATGLNILRETIMGRDLFDYAFKTYANRWMFKHPTPSDFFRTMEDASAVDLDWFWRSWFYTTDHVDLAIENFQQLSVDTENPDIEKAKTNTIEGITARRNKTVIAKTREEEKPHLVDIYSTDTPNKVYDYERKNYNDKISKLTKEQKELLKATANQNIYNIAVRNIGGIPMPIILQFTFVDGSTEDVYIPAEIWRKDDEVVYKSFLLDKEVKSVNLDPYYETADIDRINNTYPPQSEDSKFKIYERNNPKSKNLMQKTKK